MCNPCKVTRAKKLKQINKMGKFGQSLIGGLGSAVASTGMGFIGNALSQALGLSWSPQKTIQEQEAYNKRIMALL